MKFVFDLDGTICFKGQPLSEGITNALEACIENGHEIIFASARPIRDLLPVLPETMRKFSMVGGNGAFVAQNGETIEVTAFAAEIVEEVQNIIANFQLPYLVDGDWDYAYTGSEAHPIYQNLDPLKLAKKVALQDLKDIVKIVLFPGEHLNEILAALKKLPISLYEHASENIVDMSPNGIDKWNGLTKLGIAEGDFIAFGNDANDASMFVKAKESVCVGEHKVRELASLQVPSEETAVIKMLSVLNEKYKEEALID
ncbi:HAD-IIB family hydrolase [Lysinibacillus sp. G4S2]|uniref:HAD-IIB family hydrolase n=1 Tax=Lysinibacillus sp. G4S2 TaxID=3055859 RepID=UPI0025A0529F|nr:HAD-IIB family hydrolase [Lysinibacillus sp. G4S2]MDM5250679.1 HAD-IIB family hydrolase [Lysinibacillus sp. G4S2]